MSPRISDRMSMQHMHAIGSMHIHVFALSGLEQREGNEEADILPS